MYGPILLPTKIDNQTLRMIEASHFRKYCFNFNLKENDKLYWKLNVHYINSAINCSHRLFSGGGGLKSHLKVILLWKQLNQRFDRVISVFVSVCLSYIELLNFFSPI